MGNTVFFFLEKLTFDMNKTVKTWSKSLQLPYANETKFSPNMVQALTSAHLS